MKRLFAFILAMITILVGTTVFADSSITDIRVFITDISASEGTVTVKTANTLETATAITLTAETEDGNKIYEESVSAAALSTVSFSFDAQAKGKYKISAKNGNGEIALRDWVYMDYNYTDSVDRKFEYLAERGVMEPTSNEMYELRHTFKMMMGEEPHASRLFRELSQRTFINYVLNLTGDYGFTGKYNAEAADIAEKAGLTDTADGASYRPLYYEDALKILVKAMGYTTGKTDEEYVSIAENLGLVDRVFAERGDRIKTYDAVTLLFNTADVLDNLERTKCEHIFMPRFYDSNMDRISDFTEKLSGSAVSVRAVVSCDGQKTTSAVLVACLYDKDNNLVDVCKSSITASIDNVAAVAECTIDVPEFDTIGDYKIRAYLWDSMDNIAPLCAITELS